MPGADTAETASVGPSAYREAMARLASAVHVITTDGPGGRAGFTASAVCSVSDAPPTLLVCINRTASAYAAFSRNDALCVSTLGAGHEAIAGLFGGRTPMEERFAAGTWRRLRTGAPALADALAAFDCRIVDRHAVGTHEVLYCAVQAVAASGEAGALVYGDRRYRVLPRVARSGSAAAERVPAPRATAPQPPAAACAPGCA